MESSGGIYPPQSRVLRSGHEVADATESSGGIYPPRSRVLLSGHQGPRRRVLVLLSKCDVGLSDRHVIGNTYARCVNGIWLGLFLSSLWWD